MSVVILGSGQLAKMLAEAGTDLGITTTFVVQSDVSTDPVRGLGEVHTHDSAAEASAILTALAKVDAVTVETENTASDLLGLLSAGFAVRPNTASVVACQNRENERQLLNELGIPAAPHSVARQADELNSAVVKIGFPLVIKTLTEGYDGKGQWVVDSAKEWNDIDRAEIKLPVLVEKKIAFSREVSLVGVRTTQGVIEFYPPAENIHVGGILVASFAPASGVSDELLTQAQDNLGRIMTHLDYCGVMAMECFETPQGLLVNELAPRVHNSGHWTLDSDVTSQFENHMRAITGRALGNTHTDKTTLMLNILGEIPSGLSTESDLYSVYDYRKTARPGRKVGHINAHYENKEALLATLSTLAASWDNPFIDELITQLKD